MAFFVRFPHRYFNHNPPYQGRKTYIYPNLMAHERVWRFCQLYLTLIR